MSILKKIIIYQSTKTASDPDSVVITIEEFVRWIRRGILFKHLFCYREARLICVRMETLPGPFFSAVALRLLSRGKAYFEDEIGRQRKITALLIVNLLWDFLGDFLRKSKFLRQIEGEVASIKSVLRDASYRKLDLTLTPVYLRTDLSFGIRSGGSVAHIAGVLNNLDGFTGDPVFLTTDGVPTVRNDIATHVILPDGSFQSFGELPYLAFSETFFEKARKILKEAHISFIYQRYSIDNFSGAALADHFKVPFVLEYNGSEVWIHRNWGTPLRYESLATNIELLNLQKADLIVVVSRPMKDELLRRGIDRKNIIVNPNGVDPDRYSPDIDGNSVKRQYALIGKVVIGFIGTFGRWHGAEVLAEAFGLLIKTHPEYQNSVRLLMIGDGMTMPIVKDAIAKYGIADACTFTGRIPQEDGPAHLAACDILASPHVPNPDGTPFFGSPTKLFEYMAMGKGIVASDLDQIGEILKHEKTAWMVKPGEAQSLMLGLRRLIDHKELRENLGKAAREEVVANYTWKEHTRKIINEVRRTTGEGISIE